MLIGRIFPPIGIELNHFNGTDAATLTRDEVVGVSWALGPPVELDTAQMKFGDSSLLIKDDTGSKTAVASGIRCPYGTDWTYEVFVRYATETSGWLNVQLQSSIGESQFTIGINGSGQVNFSIRTSGGFYTANAATVTVAPATWYHIAVVRDVSAESYYLMFDGDRVYTHSEALDTLDPMTILVLENLGTGDVWFDESRLTASAQYPNATYVVPTGELPLF